MEFAYFDPKSLSWRTWPPSAAGDSAEYSGTWPRQGMTRRGSASPPPTSEPRTVASGSSSWPTTVPAMPSWPMLPTATTQDTRTAVGPAPSGPSTTTKKRQVRLAGALAPIFPLSEHPLLPTPAARDSRTGQDPNVRKARGRQVGLNDVATLFPLRTPGQANVPTPTRLATGRGVGVTDPAISVFPLPPPGQTDKLLPTPRASDGAKGSPRQRGSKGDLTLPSAAIGLTDPPANPPSDLSNPPVNPG
jgi:hypothetical protein